MEREILLTGIGGQSVQLAAQTLARAAMLESREVLYLGTYGGTMRGGNTDSCVIVADAPISAPPIVSRAWAALAMHHQFWAPVRDKLRPGSVIAINAGVFEAPLDRDAYQVLEIGALKLAAEAGNALAASLVLLAAFCGATGLVGVDALIEGMRASVPSYRTQHIDTNAAALRAGYAAAPAGVAAAWKEA